MGHSMCCISSLNTSQAHSRQEVVTRLCAITSKHNHHALLLPDAEQGFKGGGFQLLGVNQVRHRQKLALRQPFSSAPQ